MPFDKKNTDLTDKLQETLKVKHSTARVYASSLRQLASHLKITFEGADVSWLIRRKVLNYVHKVVNLTRRKNMASGAIAGLKLIGDDKKEAKKKLGNYREILMKADKDHKAFLVAGKRKRKFKNADKQWEMISKLWKKVSTIVNAKRLWQRGESITANEYRQIMQLIYFKFLADMPIRRLEYSDTQFATKPDKESNQIITKKGPWRWRLSNYKTSKNYGTQEYKITPGLKAMLTETSTNCKGKG